MTDRNEPRKLQPLKFVWLDAYEAGGEWYGVDDYNAEDRLMVTYGFPVAINRNYVTVASTYDPDEDNYAVAINIPIGMLKEVTHLQVGGLQRGPIDEQTLRQTIGHYQPQQD